jgi:hypothetical protein
MRFSFSLFYMCLVPRSLHLFVNPIDFGCVDLISYSANPTYSSPATTVFFPRYYLLLVGEICSSNGLDNSYPNNCIDFLFILVFVLCYRRDFVTRRLQHFVPQRLQRSSPAAIICSFLLHLCSSYR